MQLADPLLGSHSWACPILLTPKEKLHPLCPCCLQFFLLSFSSVQFSLHPTTSLLSPAFLHLSFASCFFSQVTPVCEHTTFCAKNKTLIPASMTQFCFSTSDDTWTHHVHWLFLVVPFMYGHMRWKQRLLMDNYCTGHGNQQSDANPELQLKTGFVSVQFWTDKNRMSVRYQLRCSALEGHMWSQGTL